MRDQIYCTALWAWALSVVIASGQTAVDLRTQSKDVDFSGAASTKPIQTGAAIPATCVPGQMFFLTTAPVGSNVYGCEATNVWALESGVCARVAGFSEKVWTVVICTSSIPLVKLLMLKPG